QFPRDWMQSMIAQATMANLTPNTGTMAAAAAASGAASRDSGPAAGSSDSDSDDISRSLSFFLSHQLGDTHHPGSESAAAVPFPNLLAAKGLGNMDLTGQANYGPAFTDMLEIGYDNGSRRVISMPNPLGNLSFEIPIHPPMDPPPPMGMTGRTAKGPAPPAASLLAASRAQQQQHQQQQQRQMSSGPMLGAGSMAGLFGLCHPAAAAVRPAMAVGPAVASGDGHSSSAEEPMSQQMSPKMARSQTAGRLGRHDSVKAEERSSASTPMLETGGPLGSSLLPHRVDRQLAEGTRPLLFVRPSTKPVQSRRRKRRCISDHDELLPGLLGSDGGMMGDPHGTQWQRISEQRRRDAMRENFDLLKRMLPQEYMSSDDGRELARPVLLSRFLRWVDDTLIEMENLKAEVARLRLLGPGYWAHGSAMPVPAHHAPQPVGRPTRLAPATPTAHPL
ncbi:hypothetical protein H4R19_005907, partial [Coemansia spiralis]